VNNYVAGSYNGHDDFKMLNQALIRHENGIAANRLFYLALPPSVFKDVTVLINNHCMGKKQV
jgi:glucose-6-phosphate 1-dehydrogenase